MCSDRHTSWSCSASEYTRKYNRPSCVVTEADCHRLDLIPPAHVTTALDYQHYKQHPTVLTTTCHHCTGLSTLQTTSTVLTTTCHHCTGLSTLQTTSTVLTTTCHHCTGLSTLQTTSHSTDNYMSPLHWTINTTNNIPQY